MCHGTEIELITRPKIKSHKEIAMTINFSQELSQYKDQLVQQCTLGVSQTVENCHFVTLVTVDS